MNNKNLKWFLPYDIHTQPGCIFSFFNPIQASNLEKLNKRKNNHLVQGKGKNIKRILMSNQETTPINTKTKMEAIRNNLNLKPFTRCMKQI
jgi:hypothetical protein